MIIFQPLLVFVSLAMLIVALCLRRYYQSELSIGDDPGGAGSTGFFLVKPLYRLFFINAIVFFICAIGIRA